MTEQNSALLELIDKIEHLGQFQDRIDFPSTIGQIWEIFLADVRSLIKVEVCALFLVDDVTHEFALEYAFPEDKKTICKKEVKYQIECGIFSWIINRRQPALIPALVVLLALSLAFMAMGVVAEMPSTLGKVVPGTWLAPVWMLPCWSLPTMAILLLVLLSLP